MTTTPPMSVSGTLDLRDHSTVDPTAALVAAVVQYLRNDGDVDTVLTTFRAAELVVELADDAEENRMVVVRREVLCWVPACSTLANFATWMQMCGRGTETVHYGLISGAELLDTCLPQLPTGAGVVLDPATDRVLALPPVTGIVTRELAVDQ